jgi:hypothetical protein
MKQFTVLGKQVTADNYETVLDTVPDSQKERFINAAVKAGAFDDKEFLAASWERTFAHYKKLKETIYK